MKFFGVILLFTITLLNAVRADSIRIRGNDTLGAKLVPMLCKSYKLKTPANSFEIVVEDVSSAFTMLLDNHADIVMSSRNPRKEEIDQFSARGVRLARHDAMIHCLVLVINPKNSITT
ncbi:MAG: hypothetical protein HC904_16505 [Blastochloris sp.]|nr:hypothetical protein [Blastochloris sp.]